MIRSPAFKPASIRGQTLAIASRSTLVRQFPKRIQIKRVLANREFARYRKSSSLLITTQLLRPAYSQMSPSVARLKPMSSTCWHSTPREVRKRASAAGSWLSTKNLTRLVVPDGPPDAPRTQWQRIHPRAREIRSRAGFHRHLRHLPRVRECQSHEGAGPVCTDGPRICPLRRLFDLVGPRPWLLLKIRLQRFARKVDAIRSPAPFALLVLLINNPRCARD